MIILLFTALLFIVIVADPTGPILKKYTDLPNHCIWRPHNNISVDRPFVFFHQRKAGGTSLRTTLGNAAKKLKWSSCISGGGSCGNSVYGVPVNESFVLYAGHFNWQWSVDALPKQVHQGGSKLLHHKCPTNEFSCLTNFREPIARTESCIYERFTPVFRKLKVKCINDIDIDRFADLLINFRHKHGDNDFGCLNEPFRIFATNDEAVLSSLGFSFNNETKVVTPGVPFKDLNLLNMAVNRLAHCVPIVLEIPDSKKLLQNVFPSLYARKGFDESIVLNVRKGGTTCEKMDEAHRAVVASLTTLETALYQTVVNKVTSAIEELKVT